MKQDVEMSAHPAQIDLKGVAMRFATPDGSLLALQPTDLRIR